MSNRDDVTPDDDTTGRDTTQLLGGLTIITGLGLVVAGSLGLVAFPDSTLRLLLAAGILLSAGREAIIAIVERFA